MLVRKILKFYGIVITALWIDMLTYCLCLLMTCFACGLCNDYLKSATQRGLDYGKELISPKTKFKKPW